MGRVTPAGLVNRHRDDCVWTTPGPHRTIGLVGTERESPIADPRERKWPTPVNRREVWPVLVSVLLGIVIGAAAVLLFT